jgi:hypothetical protein
VGGNISDTFMGTNLVRSNEGSKLLVLKNAGFGRQLAPARRGGRHNDSPEHGTLGLGKLQELAAIAVSSTTRVLAKLAFGLRTT